MNYVQNLDRLLGLCEKLYNQLVLIEKNNEFEQEEGELKQALRKLIIAEAIQKKQIICVTGLQGVGKTSLMQLYYGIDFKKMNITEARGEKIPVMISEKKDCTEICFYSVELKKDENNTYFSRRSPITSEEFCEKTKNAEEDSEIMYLEMEVPYKYINNEYCSFLLLPGFERRMNYWQDLVNFAVNTSDVALFATDYSSFAGGENQKLMERIKDQFGSHSMICAITHTDQTEEQNLSVKGEIQRYFELKEDQIILTGFYPNDLEKHTKWCNELTNAIQKYNFGSNEKAVYEMISEIKDQVKDSISSIEDKLDEKKIELNLEKYGIDEELKAFDNQIITIRKDWYKRLENELSAAEQESKDYILKKTVKEEDEHPFKDWLKKAGKQIFGENAKDILKRKELLKDSLLDGSVPRCTVAIVKSFFDDFESDNLICNYLLENNIDNGSYELNINNQNALMNNISLLLRGKDAVDNNGMQLTFNNDVSHTYEMLAEIAVFNYAKRYGEKIRESCPEIIENIESPIPADVFEKMSDSKKLGLGMFAMAGIDFLPDASFDVLTTLAESLSISTGAMVGIFAGVMTIASSVTLTRDINTMERKLLEQADEAIHIYYKKISDSAIEDFDEAMARLRKLVGNNLAAVQGVDSNHFALINARSYVSKLKNDINEMYQQMRIESKETKIAGLLTD